MARVLLPLAALAALTPLASAIKFTSPEPGDKLTAGSAISVKWEDGGDGPKLSDLLSYELFLFAGGNDPEDMGLVVPITTQGLFAAGNAASGMVGIAAAGKTDVNA